MFLSEIQLLSDPENWNFMPGIKNPADLPLRGYNAKELAKSHCWEKSHRSVAKVRNFSQFRSYGERKKENCYSPEAICLPGSKAAVPITQVVPVVFAIVRLPDEK
ncbi:hypothetical protein TNCV_3258521 [Trichonephila clavipes]|nr:hypothetical protein TNCV_3258521 [Trichonephila clavipes]